MAITSKLQQLKMKNKINNVATRMQSKTEPQTHIHATDYPQMNAFW